MSNVLSFITEASVTSQFTVSVGVRHLANSWQLLYRLSLNFAGKKDFSI